MKIRKQMTALTSQVYINDKKELFELFNGVLI